MLDLKNIKVRTASKEEIKEIFNDSLNTPLDSELIEIVKALADK